MAVIRLLITVLLAVAVAESAKIVFLNCAGGNSHKQIHYAVAKGLIAQGHDVTMVSMYPPKNKLDGLKEIVLNKTRNSFMTGMPQIFDDKGTKTGYWSFLLAFEYSLVDIARVWYSEPEIQRLLKEKPFDLAIVNGLFTTSILPAAKTMAKKTMYLAPGELMPTLAWTLNVPFPVYQVFTNMAPGYTIRMNFFQRMLNSFNVFCFVGLRELILFRQADDLAKEFIPNAPSAKEVERGMELVMVNMHYSMDDVQPSLPFVQHIGGITASPAKPLPKDLEEFVQGSGKHGVVVVSFGSIVPEEMMPKHVKEALIEAFRRIPQRVIFKYKLNDIPNVPSNVKLMSWLPQNDLVGHPKTKALIAHGGHFSFLEAVYHGVPLLGFPVFGDQPSNIKRAEEKLIGVEMSWRTVTADKLVDALNRVINDTRIRDSVKRHRALLRDEPMPVLDRAVFWIEHVLRHGGSHLRAEGADRLNVFQYWMLDILGFLAVVTFVFLYTVYSFLRCICCRSSKKTPNKANRQDKPKKKEKSN